MGNQIPYYYDSIDRNAIIVKPKKAFYDWLNSTDPDHGPFQRDEDNTVYLIREMDSNEDIRKWVKKNFDKMFINELNDWLTDDERWPKNRTYKMFEEWFDLEINSMIIDLEDTSITKE